MKQARSLKQRINETRIALDAVIVAHARAVQRFTETGGNAEEVRSLYLRRVELATLEESLSCALDDELDD